MDIKLPALISVIHGYFDKKGALKDLVGPYAVHGCDLVRTITEESPYAYHAQAEAELRALEGTGDRVDLYDVIDYVVRAEESRFGKRMTDLKYPAEIVRAFVEYSLEELFSHSPTLETKWDEKLSAKDLNDIGLEVSAYVQSEEGQDWWHRTKLNNAY